MSDNTVYKSIIIGIATKWKSNNNITLIPTNINRYSLPFQLKVLNFSAMKFILDTISKHKPITNTIRTVFCDKNSNKTSSPLKCVAIGMDIKNRAFAGVGRPINVSD
jgi:hypothetical protein